MFVTDTNVTLWSSEPFLAEAAEWVDGAARAAGIRLDGAREQPHLRPWSSAVRFGSDAGSLWFKVNAAGTRHEGALVGALSRLEPGLVPDVIAVDVERGWSLTRDAGPVMRSIAPPDELWPSWEDLLARYAEAQLRLAAHTAELLATGTQEVSPGTLPGQIRALVDELAEIPPDEGGLAAAEEQRLRALLETYDGWCAELAASGIPPSIQHDDLHSGNICWGGTAATARIIDWGDATVGFPLGTMLCTPNSLAWHAKVERDDPRVLRARDAFLEPFTRYADRPRLVEYVALARRTGCVTRALSYRAALLAEPVATHREQDFPVRGWLLEVFEE